MKTTAHRNEQTPKRTTFAKPRGRKRLEHQFNYDLYFAKLDFRKYWKKGPFHLLALCLMIFGLSACQNTVQKAARNVEYSAYEVIGVEKRDLLKKRVDKARDEQKEAGEDFEDALARLKKVYSFEGGKLEKEYNRLNNAYENAADQTRDVHQSIIRVETVAKDLFDEWEKELEQIQTENLRAKSRQQLNLTRNKYSEMHEALKKSEAKMDPVLGKLKDHVLYLKHNLNAQAIASLKGEAGKIQGDIESLIKDMNKSIESADQFIKSIE